MRVVAVKRLDSILDITSTAEWRNARDVAQPHPHILSGERTRSLTVACHETHFDQLLGEPSEDEFHRYARTKHLEHACGLFEKPPAYTRSEGLFAYCETKVAGVELQIALIELVDLPDGVERVRVDLRVVVRTRRLNSKKIRDILRAD